MQLPNSGQSTLALLLEANLVNITEPGSSPRAYAELCKMNNLPVLIFPENAPSNEILAGLGGNERIKAVKY